MTTQLELTDLEARVIRAALTNYVKCKSAEKMLAYHATLKSDKRDGTTEAPNTKARYERLTDAASAIVTRLP